MIRIKTDPLSWNKYNDYQEGTIFCEAMPWSIEPETTHEATVLKAKELGAVGLIHKCLDEKGAVSILAQHTLNPRKGYLQGSRHYLNKETVGEDKIVHGPGSRVFLQLMTDRTASLQHTLYFTKHELHSVKYPMICFVFSLDLLARSDYHFTIGWNHGVIDSAESFAPTDIDSFMKQLRLDENDPHHDLFMSNEVVFRNDVSLNDLKAIVVHPRIEKEFLQQLEQTCTPDDVAYWKTKVCVSEKIPLLT